MNLTTFLLFSFTELPINANQLISTIIQYCTMEESSQSKSSSSFCIREEQQEKGPYKFISVKNSPDSIMMLKKIPEVAPSIVVKPILVLLKLSREEQEKIRKEKLSFLSFDDIQVMQKYISEKLEREWIELLAPTNMAKEISEKLGHIKQIQKIHFLIKFNDSSQQLLFKGLNLNTKTKQVKDKLGRLDIDLLIEDWKKKGNLIRHHQLTRIILIRGPQNVNQRTIMAMLNQNDDSQKELMAEFYRLYAEIYGDLPKTLQELNTPQKIVEIYTKGQCAESTLINNLLRLSKDPAQIYYCQPLFKKLFESIKKVYSDQKKQKNMPSSIICWKGFSEPQQQEAFNLYKKQQGEIVQNLGFLSASLNPKIGGNFTKNFRLAITINEEERDQEMDYGYVDVSQIASNPNQCQVLFNPLNTFRVEKVEKSIIKGSDGEDDRQIHTVYLTYGSLAHIRYQKQKGQSLDKTEENYATIAQNFLSDMQQIRSQEDAFISTNYCVEGAYQYCSQQMKHAHDQKKQQKIQKKLDRGQIFKSKAETIQQEQNWMNYRTIAFKKAGPQEKRKYKIIGIAYYKLKRYEEALRNIKIYRLMLQKSYGKNHLQYELLGYTVGVLYEKMQKYQNAITSFKEFQKLSEINLKMSKQMSPKPRKPNTDLMLKIIYKIGMAYFNLKEYDYADRYFQKFMTREKKLKGMSSGFVDAHYYVGMACYYLGEYEKFLLYYKQYQDLKKEIKEEDKISSGEIFYYIGIADCHLGKYNDAVDFLTKYIWRKVMRKEIYKEEIGSNFQDAFYYLGISCYHIRDYQSSLFYCKSCLEFKQEKTEEKDISYAEILQLIGRTYVKMLRYRDAIKSYQESQSIKEQILGKTDISYGNTLKIIAKIYELAKYYMGSLDVYKEYLKVLEANFGNNHPENIEILKKIRDLNLKLKRFHTARDIENQLNRLS